METINNAASAASRAIWGNTNTNIDQSNDSRNEPVSGHTGNTSSGEPYDAGNSGNSTNTERTSAADNTETTDTSTSGNGTKQIDQLGNTAATGPVRPEQDTDKTGVTSTTSANNPDNAFKSDRPSNANDSSGPGLEPSVGADPASGAQDTQKHQGADRPNDEPNTDEHSRIQEAKAEAEKAQEVDTSGPGPRPLAETRKAGGASSSSDGDDDGPQKESHGTGTGEKYVKSSGMQAEGGDFDAANPGAGKEADRLLETKGIHREAAEPSGGDAKSDPLEDKINKPSLGEKIKAKLHKS